MKKSILIIILNILVVGCTQEKPIESKPSFKKLSVLCKVWGVVKYNHPSIIENRLDWDSVLTNNISYILKIENTDSLKIFFEDFIPPLQIQKSENNNIVAHDSLVYSNSNINWIADTTFLSNLTINNLNQLVNNKAPFPGRYINANQWVKNPIFDSDTSHKNCIMPDSTVRLLSLFRYWNIINYYYPYKYLLDNDWDQVLEEFIPIFLNANDIISYNLAICQLTARINDNHALTFSPALDNHFGQNYLPAKFQIIENKTIITHLYSDSLAELNNLHLGDIILKINNLDINEIRDSLYVYFSGSDSITVQNIISYYLIRSQKNQINLTICRNDTIYLISPNTYSRKVISEERRKKKHIPTVKHLGNGVTYVNLSRINYGEADTIFSEILNSKSIIIDLRQNCKFILHDIARILFKEKYVFYSVTKPVYYYPGVFYYEIAEPTGPDSLNPEYYKGNIVVLINNITQSIGEFTAMSLAVHDNVTLIGSRTAGTDGNVSMVFLPGNIRTNITGIGIYWPDGKITQRKGIHPDIEVLPTINSYINKQDLVLDYTIELLNNK